MTNESEKARPMELVRDDIQQAVLACALLNVPCNQRNVDLIEPLTRSGPVILPRWETLA